MLSDHEQRALDATAANLAADDPVLAAQLGRHDLDPSRRHRGWSPIWPPVLMIALCLVLLILPGLLAGRLGSASNGAPVHTSSTSSTSSREEPGAGAPTTRHPEVARRLPAPRPGRE